MQPKIVTSLLPLTRPREILYPSVSSAMFRFHMGDTPVYPVVPNPHSLLVVSCAKPFSPPLLQYVTSFLVMLTPGIGWILNSVVRHSSSNAHVELRHANPPSTPDCVSLHCSVHYLGLHVITISSLWFSLHPSVSYLFFSRFVSGNNHQPAGYPHTFFFLQLDYPPFSPCATTRLVPPCPTPWVLPVFPSPLPLHIICAFFCRSFINRIFSLECPFPPGIRSSLLALVLACPHPYHQIGPLHFKLSTPSCCTPSFLPFSTLKKGGTDFS